MRNLTPIRMDDEVPSCIRTLHPVLEKRIHAALQEIRTVPGTGKPQQDDLAGYRSFRVGRFRIVHRKGVRREIEIVAVGPRRGIYEETARLIAKQDRQGTDGGPT